MQILTSMPTAASKPRVSLGQKASADVAQAPASTQDAAQLSVETRAAEPPSSAQTAALKSAAADPAQARRISNFVRETKESGAHNLRGIMGMMAGQMTGMTIGSLIFAPLAFHYGNLYIATGGAALTGAALAFAGHKLASREVKPGSANSSLANAGVALGGLANSLPRFAYPTVAGATVG
jgi:hypothetical protein